MLRAETLLPASVAKVVQRNGMLDRLPRFQNRCRCARLRMTCFRPAQEHQAELRIVTVLEPLHSIYW